MRKELIVFFTILLFASMNLPAQNPYIQHYTTVDGLPSNTIYQVYQDSHKFIWFATDAGVARFDGSHFTYYRKHDGLSSSEVIRIKEDSFGRIWFFNLNATLNYYYQNTIYNGTNAPFLDSLISKEFFRDFFEDEDKTIYFYNDNQRNIFALDSQNNVKKYKLPSVLIKNEYYPESKPIEGMIVKYISKAATGEFYLLTAGGFFKLNSLGEEPTLVSDAFCIRAVFPVSKKSCNILLDLENQNQWEIRKCNDGILVDTITPPISLGAEFISSILEDVNGLLWISTFDKGVFCYRDGKIIHHLDIKQGQAIIQDHENNIWISSMKDGVYKVSPYINQHIQYENSNFQNCAILGLSHHISNGIWCTNGQTVYILQNNDLFTSDFQNEKSSFNQLLQVNDSILLIGEISQRPYALKGIRPDPSAKKVYFNEVSVSYIPFKKFNVNITRDEINTFNLFYLYFIYPDKLFRDIKMVDIGERIYYTFYNSNNELFVNAKRNYLYKNDSLSVCEELSCFDNKIITDHLILNDATELFNLEGDSLFLLNNKQLFNLTSAFGYPIDLQIKYMDYHEPALFIATSRNIYICENPLNILDKKPVQLQPVDISFRNIHDILFSNDLLYIASDDGLTAIPYSAIHEIKTHSPIPYFQSIQINDKEEKVNRQDISLSGRNRIHIVFSGIDYCFSPIIFSYKLEGADIDWTIGTGTNVVYQDLPRGDYIFKLKVRKPTSPWSEHIEYRITIEATLWRHPLFFVVLSVLFAGLFSLLIIRRKNLQLRRREIDHQMVTLEQKALQSMMNPHFIFNTLGSIQNYLLQNKSGEAGLYLSQFARLIRLNISSINSALISLEEEVDRLRIYLDLEKFRMENKFEYVIEFDQGIEEDEVYIPSMIIQPFVENSVWHGISALEDKGLIKISFSMHSSKALNIIVEDNGIGIKQSVRYASNNESHLHLSMEVTRKRLEIIGKKMKVDTSMDISETSPGSPNPGTRVALIVPFTYSEKGNSVDS